MKKEEILIAIKEIQCRYSIPALEKNFTDKDYAIQQFEKLVIHLANQQEEKDKEIEKLNNIINELKQKLNLAENILYDYLYKDEKITKELYDSFKGLKGDGSNE